MMRSNFLSLISAFALGLALLTGSPLAWASSDADVLGVKTDARGDDKGEPQPGDANYIPDNSSNMPMLLVPVMIDGKKSHYIFVSYRLVMHNELQVDRVNQKIAWLHDAFMRDVFTSNPVDPNNPHRLNEEYFNRRFREIAKDILHDDIVKSVYFTNVLSQKQPVSRERKMPRRVKESASSKGH